MDASTISHSNSTIPVKNRLMGRAYTKVKNSIMNSEIQHYDSLRAFVFLYLKAESEESKREEIRKLYYDKLILAQW